MRIHIFDELTLNISLWGKHFLNHHNDKVVYLKVVYTIFRSPFFQVSIIIILTLKKICNNNKVLKCCFSTLSNDNISMR